MESIKGPNMNGIWDGAGSLHPGNIIYTRNSIIFNDNMNDVDDHIIDKYADDLDKRGWDTSKNSGSFTIYHPSHQKEESCSAVPSLHPPPPEDPLPTENEAANNFRDWLRTQIQTDSLSRNCLGSKRDFLNRSYPASRGLGVLEINRIFSRIFSTKNSQSTSFTIPAPQIMVQNFNAYYGENIAWNF